MAPRAGIEPPILRFSVACSVLIRRQPCQRVVECLFLPSSYRRCTMSAADRPTTVVSTKGQVILPKAIRQQRRWEAGTRLVVEDTPDGVLLRPVPLFPVTKSKDVFGSLRHSGPPKSLEEMQAGIASEARRRHARS